MSTDRGRGRVGGDATDDDRGMRTPAPLPRPLTLAPFRAADGIAAGATPRRLRARDLEAPFHGVRDPSRPAGDALALARLDEAARLRDRVQRRCSAYSLVMATTHAFSHGTAAVLHGIPLPRRVEVECDEMVHVVALDGGRAPRGRGVRGTSTSARPVVVIRDALRLLSPEDTWCALAGCLSLDELIAAGDRLLGLPKPIASTGRIDAAIARHGRRVGAHRLRLAREQLRADVHSPRETRARLQLVRAGLPEPLPNAVIQLRSGRRTRGDLVFPAYRVLVEYDGEQHRLDPRQWAIDVARLNDLAQDGWCVIRITRSTPADELVERTRLALLERGWRP